MADVVWLVRAHVNERRVIDRLFWTCKREGWPENPEHGDVALPPPPADAVAAFIGDDAPDPDGFMRPEWVDRRMLTEWLFAALGPERFAIEARVAGVSPPAPEVPVQPTSPEAVSAPAEDPDPSAGVVTAPINYASAETYIGSTAVGTEQDVLIGKICARAIRIKRDRREARYDTNARERQRQAWLAFQHKHDLGLEISAAETAAYEEWLAAADFDRRTQAHADSICESALEAPIEMLRVMLDHIEEGWP